MKRRRVLVIGSGPAGLSAATRLLERAGDRVSVELIYMGHHIGGKAASYSDDDDRTVEHGWHMVLGFYRNMRGLMRRAGIDVDKTLRTMRRKVHPFESFDQRIHTLDAGHSRLGFALSWLGYSGLPLGDRLHFGRFMGQTFLRATSGEPLEQHDDICFRSWALEHGLREHVTRYSLFRNLREAYFNFPESISAYHVLQSMKLMSNSELAEMFVVRGGFTEKVWQPIADYFEKLGGKMRPYTMATDWVYRGRKIVAVRVARPDGSGHNDGETSWQQDALPTTADTEENYDKFDYVISTIPVAVLKQMNRKDERLWRSPYFSRISKLRSGATLAMTVLTRRPYMNFPGPVFGLPAPMGIGVNMKPYWDEYKRPDIGAAVHFMGQEAGFETWTDQQIIDFTLDNFSAVPSLGSIRKAGITHIEFHRNRSAFERLFLCEPGVNQFRPGVRTPFRNLFFAGDWVRNSVDLVCMEGAITSGRDAADALLEEIRT